MKRRTITKLLLASTLALTTLPTYSLAAQTKVTVHAKVQQAMDAATQTMMAAYAIVQTAIAANQLADRAAVNTQYVAAKAAEKAARGAISKYAKNDATLLKNVADMSAKYTTPVLNYLLAHATYDAIVAATKKLEGAQTLSSKEVALQVVEKNMTSATTVQRLKALDVKTRAVFEALLEPIQTAMKQTKVEVSKPRVTSVTIGVTGTIVTIKADFANYEGKEAIAKIYAMGDLTKSPIAELKAKVQGGKVTFSEPNMFNGTHKVVVEFNGEKTDARSFTVVSSQVAKIDSIQQTSLKTAKITFTAAVDEASLTNLRVTANGQLLPYEFIVADNKQSGTIVFGTKQANGTKVNFTAEGVKAVLGTSFARFEKEVVFSDEIAPQLLEVKALNKKQLLLKFSEPMYTNQPIASFTSDIKIADNLIIAKFIPNDATATVMVELATAMPIGLTKVEVRNFVDYAGLKIAPLIVDVIVPDDITPPSVTKAEAINKGQVRLTFSEKVAFPGVVKVNGLESTPQEVANSNGTEWLASANLGEATDVKVEYKGQKDIVDNTVTEWQVMNFKMIVDTTAPTVSQVVKEDKLILTFSKPMKQTGTIRLLQTNKDVAVSSLAFKEGSNQTVLEIPLTRFNLVESEALTYQVVIQGMTDATVRENALPQQTLAFTMADTKKPSIVGGYVVNGKDDTITLYFSEEMNEATIRNLNNYIVGSTPLATMMNVTIKAVDAKSITFSYPNASQYKGTMTVFALKDVAGNMMDTVTLSPFSNANVAVASVKATKKTEVSVQFNSEIQAVTADAIKVEKLTGTTWSTEATPVVATIDPKDKTKVLFTLNKELTGSLTQYRISEGRVQAITNIYNDTFNTTSNDTFGHYSLIDGFAPELIALYKHATEANKIVLKYSEPINDNVGLQYDFRLRNMTDGLELLPGVDFSVARSTVDTSELHIVITKTGFTNKVFTIELTNTRFLTDTEGNKATIIPTTIIKSSNGLDAQFSN